MDQDDVQDDIRKEWQDALASRIMQFKVGDFKDSNIRMLTDTLKADWIQLPGNQGAWMVLVGRKRGVALYQQI